MLVPAGAYAGAHFNNEPALDEVVKKACACGIGADDAGVTKPAEAVTCHIKISKAEDEGGGGLFDRGAIKR